MSRLSELYKGEYGLDFYLRVAKGEISGITFYNIFGYKQGISTTVMDDVSQIPSITVIPYPNGIQLRAVSSSANDISVTGSGIRTLELYYLDTSYNLQSETITMNGLTPVNTVAVNIQRVLWMHAITAGTGGVAAGNISLTNIAGTVTYEYIAAGGNRSLTSHFTVPDGKTGCILGWQSSSVKQDMSIRLRATAHFHNRTLLLLPNVFIFHSIMVLKDSSLFIPLIPPLCFPARCDIKVSALAGTANGDCESGFSILLIDD